MADNRDSRKDDEGTKEDFARQAEMGSQGFLKEYWHFLMHNKKWWLIPIVVALLLVGALIIFGGGAAAPFIYTLF